MTTTHYFKMGISKLSQFRNWKTLKFEMFRSESSKLHNSETENYQVQDFHTKGTKIWKLEE